MRRIVLKPNYLEIIRKLSDGDENIEEMELKDFDTRNMAVYGTNVNLQRTISLFYDNLKPVQRRALYTMAVKGLKPNKPFAKCASVVGTTMEKYHPHSDTSIYTSLIYMRQPWRQLLPLVDIKGNYGNADNSSAYAQMRYVECKLSEFAWDCFFSDWDLESHLVDFKPAYNGKDWEPIYLPAKYPLFLCSWGSGLGFGISTNTPGFLPQDAFNAVIKLIDDPNAKIVLYPEDPLGCTILNKKVFKEFVDYDMNKEDSENLKFRVRSTYSVKDNIIHVHNTPYEVDPIKVYERISDLVQKGKLDGLVDMEVKLKKGDIPQLKNSEDTAEFLIEFKKGYDPHIIMEKLYKLTGFETTFPLNCVYVDSNKNKKYNLRESILKWTNKRRKGLKRKYRTDINEYQKRISVLEALMMLFEKKLIDKVIKIMRNTTRNAAIELFITEFKINDYQAKQIASMKISDLATDSYEDYCTEKVKKLQKIDELMDILKNPTTIDNIIKSQMEDGIKKYSRKRQSLVIDSITDDTIDTDTKYTICVTDTGYIKKLPEDIDSFGAVMENSEIILIDQTATNIDKIVTFTADGKIFGDVVGKLPDSQLDGVGYNINKPMTLISGIISSKDDSDTVICVTKNGTVKRSKSQDYFAAAPSSVGIKLVKDDSLVSVLKSHKKDDRLLIYTKMGKAVLFNISDITVTSRVTSGVIGMKLELDDEVIGAKIVKSSDTHMITISSKGEVKKFLFENNLANMKRADMGVEVMSKGEELHTVTGVSNKDTHIVLFNAKNTDGEKVGIDFIPVKTRLSSGTKLLLTRKGNDLILIERNQLHVGKINK